MIKINKEEIKRITKYLFSSGSSFLIDILLFTIFDFLLNKILPINASIFVSTFLARVISSLYNYLINSRIVFKSKKKNAIIKYYILVIVQMVISATLVMIVNNVIKVNTTIIKFFIDIVIFIVNYIIQRNIIFKK